MVASSDEREISRIIRTAKLAFGNAAQLPPLALERDQQIDRKKAGSVSAMFGGLLALGAIVGAGTIAWHRTRPPIRLAKQDVGAVKPFVAAVPAEPAKVDDRRRAPRDRAATARRAPGTIGKRAPAASPPAPTRERTAGDDRPNRYIAEPLFGEALRQALVEDSLRTQELNRAELQRLGGRS